MLFTSTQLALLVEIQRTGSLARAALNLDVTPPAVSQQLARLERDVGVALVERGARGARLTPLGASLALHGTRVAEELVAAQETADEFLGVHLNRLRIGAPPSLSETLLPDVLASIRYRFPNAEITVVDVMSDAGAGLIADGALDLALSASYTELPKNDVVAQHHLLDDPMMAVLPYDHPLGEGNADQPIPLGALAEESWVSGPPGRPSRIQLDDAAADYGFVPKVPFMTESYNVAQSLSDSGVAVSLIPRLALNSGLTTIVRPLTQTVVRRIVAVVPTSVDHVPLAGEFLRDLRQVAESVSERARAE